jgi:hypothetical protein
MAMVNRLVAGISNGQGTVGKLLTDDKLYVSLQEFADAANRWRAACAPGAARSASC